MAHSDDEESLAGWTGSWTAGGCGVCAGFDGWYWDVAVTLKR